MATPVLTCGFECAAVATGSHFTTLSAAGSWSTTTVRSGARSLRFNPAAASCQAGIVNLTASGGWVVRIYVYFATRPTTTIRLVGTNQTLGPQVRYQASDTSIYASIGTAIAASGFPVVTGQWYRIDAMFEIGVSVGDDICTVAVDGTSLAVASATTAAAAAVGLALGDVTWTGDLFWDDLIVSHTLADYPLGAGYVNHFVPTSDGTHNVAGTADFQRTLTAVDILNATTTAYQLVDDVPLESGASVDWINMLAPVNATDYVECVFGPAPGISTPTNPPRAVEAIAGIHQSATGAGNMMIRLNDNGTEGTVYTATAVAGEHRGAI